MLAILVWYAVRGFKDAAVSQARHELGTARGFIRREAGARMAPVAARMEAGRRAGHRDPWWWLHHGVRTTRAAWAGTRAAARASRHARRAAARVTTAGRQGAREAAATRRAGLPYQRHGVCPHCGAVVPAGWIGPASCLTCTPVPAPAAEVAEPEPVPASRARRLAVVPDAAPDSTTPAPVAEPAAEAAPAPVERLAAVREVMPAPPGGASHVAITSEGDQPYALYGPGEGAGSLLGMWDGEKFLTTDDLRQASERGEPVPEPGHSGKITSPDGEPFTTAHTRQDGTVVPIGTYDPAAGGFTPAPHTSPDTGADSTTNEKGTAVDTIISAPGVDGDAGSDLASTKGASGGIDGMATNLVQEIDAILGNLQGKHADGRVIAYFTEMQELAAELSTKAEGAGALLEGVHTDIADTHAAAGHENVADTEWYQEA